MFSATDNFNRADANPVGGNWVTCTGSNNARIVSNQLKSSSTGSYIYYNATTANDQYSQCVQAASVCGPAVRLQGTSRDGYFYHVNSATLYSRVSGTANSILTTGDTPSTTAVYKLEVIGSTLTVYKDGISIGSVTNTDFTSGWTGIYIGSNTGKVDDWAGGDSGQAMTADNSIQTNSTDSGAIVQTNVVTGSDVTQANSSTSGAIVQTMLGEMLGDNSTQVNTSTSGHVTQSHILKADNVVITSDNFDRDDANPVGGNWVTSTGSNDAKIVSGKLASTASASYVYYNADSPDDQFSECIQSASGGGLIVRSQPGSRDCYFYVIYTASLYKKVGGVNTLIANTGDSPNTTSKYKLSITGNTLKVYKDGIQIGIDYIDNELASGHVGLYVGNGTGRLDNWSGTIISSENVQVNGSTSGAIVMTHALIASDSIQVNTSNNGAIIQVQTLSAGNSIQLNQSSSGKMTWTPGYWYEEAAEILNWDDVPTDNTTWTPTPPSTSIWN